MVSILSLRGGTWGKRGVQPWGFEGGQPPAEVGQPWDNRVDRTVDDCQWRGYAPGSNTLTTEDNEPVAPGSLSRSAGYDGKQIGDGNAR
jgi:hypothetical protein